MPFCLVRADPEMFLPPIREAIYVGEDTREFPGLPKLIRKLPTIVAEALSVPGTKGELKPDEIEVKVEAFGHFDIHHKNVEIIIWANEYPARKENLDQRRAQIEQKAKENLESDTTAFVWVLLSTGSFGEF